MPNIGTKIEIWCHLISPLLSPLGFIFVVVIAVYLVKKCLMQARRVDEGKWGQGQIFPDLVTRFHKQSSLLIRRLSSKAIFEEEQR